MASRNKNNILFEKFQIVECLKKDESGSVFRARHLYLNKEIILKTLNRNVIADKTIISRFLREARILAGLDHPNIIKVLDFGKHQEFLYISFAYFESRNLRVIINENKTTDDQKFNILRQLVRGLAAVHAAGIIHRDLKPENILINSEMDVKIADFGLALAANENIVTQKSSVVGTPGYMSPEQVRGEKLTARSDLFALGIILFELFGGKNPFIGKDLNATLNKILQFQFDRIRNKIKDFPEIISQVLEKIMQNQQSNRLESAGVLLKIVDPESISNQRSKIDRKYIAYFAVFSSVILIVLILSWIYYDDSGQAETLSDTISGPDSAQVLSYPGTEEKISENIPDQTKPFAKSTTSNSIIATAEDKNEIKGSGNLFLAVQPAAKITINSGESSGILQDTIIALPSGTHILQFFHPKYPQLKDTIRIQSGEITTHRVNLDTMCAYFHCVVYPWGEIFINGRYFAQTPFFHYIKLTPGSNILRIKNPDFREFTDTLYINRDDTLDLQINMEKEVLK
jgi:serine/threonine-protein kinase